MSAFLGAWSLGALLTLQARIGALIQDGTFRVLGPLAAGAFGGILVGSAAARLLSRPSQSGPPRSRTKDIPASSQRLPQMPPARPPSTSRYFGRV